MELNTSYLKPNDIIVVACSGGPDSMCLLHLLKNDPKNFKLIVVHVNHKMRPESDIEYIKVKEYCDKNDIFFEGYEILDYNNDNFHNEARIKRYNFFKDVIKKYNAKYLATAHHGDDLVETILMKISRGSNLSGYAGFREIVVKDNYTCIRPLIHFTKAQIEKYMNDNNLWYAVDNSNLEDHYTRNRYRHHVLNFLKDEEPNIHEKYYKYSSELLEACEFIDKIVDDLTKDVYKDGVIHIDLYKKLDYFVRKRLIGNILHTIYGDDLFLISDKHIELIDNLANMKKANAIANLPMNIIAVKNYEILEIKVNNVIKLDLDNYPFNDYLRLGEYVFTNEENDLKSNYVIRLDSREITLPLYFRYRKTGDKIKIKNLNGSKKIKDIFIDSKINLEERDLIPILVDSSDKVLWIPGIKKSQFDKDKSDFYDIIIKCERKSIDEEEK